MDEYSARVKRFEDNSREVIGIANSNPRKFEDVSSQAIKREHDKKLRIKRNKLIAIGVAAAGTLVTVLFTTATVNIIRDGKIKKGAKIVSEQMISDGVVPKLDIDKKISFDRPELDGYFIYNVNGDLIPVNPKDYINDLKVDALDEGYTETDFATVCYYSGIKGNDLEFYTGVSKETMEDYALSCYYASLNEKGMKM